MRTTTSPTARTLQALCVTVTAALLATGCGRDTDSGPGKDAPAEISGGKAKGKVVMWSMGEEDTNTLKDLAKKFERENPDVDVQITAVPWSSAHDKLTTAIAGGNTPDVSLIGSTWMAELAGMNGFQATPKSFKASSFYPGQWDTTKYKDTAYGVPFSADTQVVYYRADLAEKAGIKDALAGDWDGYRKDLKALQATAGKQNAKLSRASGLTIGFNSWIFWLPLVWQQGGDIYDAKTGKFTFDSPAVAKALKYYASIPKRGLALTNRTDNVQAFQDGVVAVHQDRPWVGGKLRKDAKALDGKWKTMPMPSGKQSAGFAGGSDLAVFKDADNPDAAWKFVKFLTEPANLAAYAKDTGALPPPPKRGTRRS
ncbi:extracellular solute-binding protein [Streptomyces sp. 3N207]|uniref:extracellular solute-binding protein n=1 Tax=Streptomyces sp. 3N207 TaxID=3457417 RepID=UPI003FD48074